MICRSVALTATSLVILAILVPTHIALADQAEAEVPAQVQIPAGERQVEKIAPIPSTTANAAANCKPAPLPVYIENWGRLAELTQSDPVVFPKAEFWARRREHTDWIVGSGLILGGGAIVLGTVDRLTNDAWSKTAKWMVAGGVGVELVSIFVAWAFGPDRDDLLTVINQWNLHHSDHPLAP